MMFLRVLAAALHPETLSFYAVAIRNLFTRSQQDLLAIWDGLVGALEALSVTLEARTDAFAFRAVGERHLWPVDIRQRVESLESRSARSPALLVQFLIAYSGDLDVSRAIRHLSRKPECAADILPRVQSYCEFNQDVDLVLRTGSNMRLTDGPFLATRKAEYVLVAKPFPEVSERDIRAALEQLLQTPAPANYQVRESDHSYARTLP